MADQSSDIFEFSKSTKEEYEGTRPPPAPAALPAASSQAFQSDETTNENAAEGGIASTITTSPAELPRLKVKLHQNLAKYQDFPSKGILFEDIMPLFADVQLHKDLISALQILICNVLSSRPKDPKKPGSLDVIVGLESRGFLVGPTLAYKLGTAFVPVRKQGKLPGPCETESYQKEYGADHFQMQQGSIKKGQRALIIDDIIATGGSASAAGKLVRKMGGDLIGYVFMLELAFLKGKEKLDAPVYTLLEGQE